MQPYGLPELGKTGLIDYLSHVGFSVTVWHEHVGTDKTHMIKATWWQRLLFLPHYAEYHHEHHEKPNVPYNKLKDIATGPRKKISEIH